MYQRSGVRECIRGLELWSVSEVWSQGVYQRYIRVYQKSGVRECVRGLESGVYPRSRVREWDLESGCVSIRSRVRECIRGLESGSVSEV